MELYPTTMEEIHPKYYFIAFFIILLVIQAVVMAYLLIKKFRMNPARALKTSTSITSRKTKNKIIELIEKFTNLIGKLFRS